MVNPVLKAEYSIGELRKTLDRPAKGVIVKSVETAIGSKIDYKPHTFTFIYLQRFGGAMK